MRSTLPNSLVMFVVSAALAAGLAGCGQYDSWLGSKNQGSVDDGGKKEIEGLASLIQGALNGITTANDPSWPKAPNEGSRETIGEIKIREVKLAGAFRTGSMGPFSIEIGSDLAYAFRWSAMENYSLVIRYTKTRGIPVDIDEQLKFLVENEIDGIVTCHAAVEYTRETDGRADVFISTKASAGVASATGTLTYSERGISIRSLVEDEIDQYRRVKRGDTYSSLMHECQQYAIGILPTLHAKIASKIQKYAVELSEESQCNEDIDCDSILFQPVKVKVAAGDVLFDSSTGKKLDHYFINPPSRDKARAVCDVKRVREKLVGRCEYRGKEGTSCRAYRKNGRSTFLTTDYRNTFDCDEGLECRIWKDEKVLADLKWIPFFDGYVSTGKAEGVCRSRQSAPVDEEKPAGFTPEPLSSNDVEPKT